MVHKNKNITKTHEEELADDSSESIKASVKDGSYFKDGLDWYLLRYVNPFCERTILIFAALLSIIVLIYLIEIVDDTFPLVEEFPVIVKSKDQSLYYPNLLSIKSRKDKEIKTVDEAIIKYLASVYIKDREEYDYSDAEISDINAKFRRMKNTSSVAQYRQFQLFMSKDNPDSPIYQFGKDVVKTVEIKSVKFIRGKSKGFTSRAKSFLTVQIPKEAKIRFITKKTSYKKSKVREDIKEYVVNIGFTFSGASKDQENKSLDFMVNKYQLYKVQK